MELHNKKAAEEEPVAGTPDDVAILYAWAEVRGATYRDFSALRRESRAEARYRIAQMRVQLELKAQAEAEAAAEAAEWAALAAHRMAWTQGETEGTQAERLRNAEAAAAQAESARVEALRRGDAAAQAAAAAEREGDALAKAQHSARMQAEAYTAFKLRVKEPGESQPGTDSAGGALEMVRREPVAETAATIQGSRSARQANPSRTGQENEGDGDREHFEQEIAGPAWLYGAHSTAVDVAPYRVLRAPADGDAAVPLHEWRRRGAGRWVALEEAFEQARPQLPPMSPASPDTQGAPVLLVFSLAGGVGKTSLVATLGRALASLGEEVALADTSAPQLLPFYFGARELPAGVVHRFPAPAGSTGAPISVVAYDNEGGMNGTRHQAALAGELLRQGQGHQRMLVDLAAGSAWLIHRMADLHPVVLVPVAPDMNSVISMQAIEGFFEGIVDAAGRPMLPYYVLNGFDAAFRLHLEVREVLRRQLTERLLNVMIRRSPAVSEALAEGMTVMDYTHGGPVAGDYAELAAWLRRVSPPAAVDLPGARRGKHWSRG